jgi:hypothetical protein
MALELLQGRPSAYALAEGPTTPLGWGFLHAISHVVRRPSYNLEAESTGDGWTALEAHLGFQALLAGLDVSNGAKRLEFTRRVYNR